MTRRLCAVLVLLAPFTAAPMNVRTAVNVTPASVAAFRGSKATRTPRPRLSAVASPAAVRPPSGRGVSAHRPPRPVAAPPRPAHTSRSYLRPPLSGGPVTFTTRPPKPPSVYDTAPHTASGLRAWIRTLPWPWPGIITCESASDGSWRASSGSRARGIMQMEPETWASLGYHGDPAGYSWRFQLHAAERLRARDGLGAWQCAHILGYVS